MKAKTLIPNSLVRARRQWPKKLLLLGVFAMTTAASAQDIMARVDSMLVNFPDVQPKMMNGRVMVPVRGVFEHLNAVVTWNGQTRSITTTHGSNEIRLPLNSYYAYLNGRQVRLDAPATIYQGRMMVPLRFLSESLGASVEWIASTRTVEINSQRGQAGEGTFVQLTTGTVIPFTLDQRLGSETSSVGDKFTAKLDPNGTSNYQGIVAGTVLEGHVDVARAKSGEMPGVLGLAFDRIKLPSGQYVMLDGALIGLDSKSVAYSDGRMTAKPEAKNDHLKFVGYGAGAGALVSILTKGNMLSDSLIGAALGYLYAEIKQNPGKSRNVVAEPGMKFGVRLTEQLAYRYSDMNNR